ncbi:NAD(P)/FAD-dependent oxidoreductase [Paenibacillus urinalis]|uniref:NAD(P)/FAD-dependent oxidoreductase n=1 Tax=Paenibacillus urinalis TaxID=521520 RepID=A0AAX3N5Z4_9BACL|nr:NAD(P)/FAD-dependent oxidoreductase [Paenibacillus urinalis]WDH84623.1 NAD(P)/FAD-dependent oxidoreductase [Paenibacillus urinalis]
MIYDCIIVGGGIAGLQAAIQLGRYSIHKVLVIDAGEGRSTICRNYHNILGFPEGISGEEIRRRGRAHAEATGIEFCTDRITSAKKEDELFKLSGDHDQLYQARTLLLATGITDRYPNIPGLRDALGMSVYICPDCDGYEIENKRTVIMGSGVTGAGMANILAKRASEMIYINHDQAEVTSELRDKLSRKGVQYIEEAIIEVESDDKGMITAVKLASGAVVEAERGFIAFGGNKVHSELAAQLGAQIEDNKHVEADGRSRMSSVPNLWIAGDIGLHSEQAAVAMGDGLLSAIWINKALHQMRSS